MKQFVAAAVQRPTQLDSAIKNTFAITIPAGWLTTITSVHTKLLWLVPLLYLIFQQVSCGNCVNLVRIRRVVNGALEKHDLVSFWDTIDKTMVADGSESDALALPCTEDSYVLVVETFHSKNRARKDPRKLPGFKDLSTNLRVITVFFFFPSYITVSWVYMVPRRLGQTTWKVFLTSRHSRCVHYNRIDDSPKFI